MTIRNPQYNNYTPYALKYIRELYKESRTIYQSKYGKLLWFQIEGVDREYITINSQNIGNITIRNSILAIELDSSQASGDRHTLYQVALVSYSSNEIKIIRQYGRDYEQALPMI